MSALQSFQDFLYRNIPLVQHMQLELKEINEHRLIATAPLAPNINDKATVFGGSSGALMTICGWTLIKFNLESYDIHNDVVIHKAKTNWVKAQTDDLTIQVALNEKQDWQALTKKLSKKNRPKKITVDCHINNQNHEPCSTMTGHYVILKQSK